MQVVLWQRKEASDGNREKRLALYGTEQGIQLRSFHTDSISQSDLYSISYTELLEMSEDFEKGRPKQHYGTPGSGLEFKPRSSEP